MISTGGVGFLVVLMYGRFMGREPCYLLGLGANFLVFIAHETRGPAESVATTRPLTAIIGYYSRRCGQQPHCRHLIAEADLILETTPSLISPSSHSYSRIEPSRAASRCHCSTLNRYGFGALFCGLAKARRSKAAGTSMK
jgi:hypothetical protein